jgi:hypothetical protein|mmetsp:Transcript_91112/g.142160  ORF Transcript_91112/g.142160 Transcript_91112/m.142160 type:complete len:126 (+) Transcript_91112:1659-2036(+)
MGLPPGVRGGERGCGGSLNVPADVGIGANGTSANGVTHLAPTFTPRRGSPDEPHSCRTKLAQAVVLAHLTCSSASEVCLSPELRGFPFGVGRTAGVTGLDWGLEEAAATRNDPGGTRLFVPSGSL